MSQVLKNRIMRRVYVIWALKKATSPFVMKLLLLAGMLRLSFSMVSVPNVLKNSPPIFDAAGNYRFFVSAFWNTELGVKLLALSLFSLAVLLTADMLRRTPEWELRRI